MTAGLASVAAVCLVTLVSASVGVARFGDIPARSAIDCRNFTEAATCAYGVADYGGQMLGRADFCDMPLRRTQGMQLALKRALLFLADSQEVVDQGNADIEAAQRQVAKRARYTTLPIDCALVERDVLQLLRELGARPSLDDDLTTGG